MSKAIEKVTTAQEAISRLVQDGDHLIIGN